MEKSCIFHSGPLKNILKHLFGKHSYNNTNFIVLKVNIIDLIRTDKFCWERKIGPNGL